MFSFVVGVFTDPSQLNNFIRKDDLDGRFYCTICESFSHRTKYNTRNHVEAKHFPESFLYKCNICSDIFTNATGLSNHRTRKHKHDK